MIIDFKIACTTVTIKHFWWYIFWIVAIGIAMRLFFSIFKARAIACGEADVNANDKDNKVFKKNQEEYPSDWGFGKKYRRCLWGFGENTKVDDFWLPFCIGLVELFLYPMFILMGRFEIIGGWLVVKTAAHWGKWKESRTPFNRYLFANLLVILAALILTKSCFSGLTVTKNAIKNERNNGSILK